MRPIRSTAMLALGAAALVAPAAASAAAPIKVSEKEFSIAGVPKTLKHGVKYTFTLANKGKFPHDMLFDGKGVHDVGMHNAKADRPGQERVVHGHVPEGRHVRVLLRHQGPPRQGHEGQGQGHLIAMRAARAATYRDGVLAPGASKPTWISACSSGPLNQRGLPGTDQGAPISSGRNALGASCS